ncbi:MAG: thioredoxin [Chloroflexi bacterium]|nr:thioredoxin [Chloroflexota bacterium]
MPALIDQSVCNCAPRCFAIPACPVDAIAFRVELGLVTIESERCGACPGPCTNFCDRSAIKFSPSYDDFDLLEARVLGTLTSDEIAAERTRRKAEAARLAEAARVSPVVALTAATFQQTLRTTDLPVAIDFWADWCGPCKQMAPVFERLATEYAGQMLFAKVDTDAEQALAAQLGIQSLPTLLFVFRGQLVDRVVGALPAPQLQARIAQVLAMVQSAMGGGPPAGNAGPAPSRPASPTGRGAQSEPPRPTKPRIILP